MKYAAYAFLISLYAVFVWFNKAESGPFITMLTSVIMGLGVYHVHQSASKQATDAANTANPVPPPKPLPTTVTKEGESQ